VVDPSFLQSVNVSVLPRSDNVYDLGSSTFRWRNAYIGGALYVYGGANFNNTNISGVNALYIADTGAGEGLIFGSGVHISVWTTTQGGENAFVLRTTSTYPFKFKIDGVDKLEISDAVKSSLSVVPTADNTYDLGSTTLRWRNAYVAGVGDLGSLQIGGTEVIDATRILKNIASVAQSLLPSADASYDLGSATYRWRDMYLDRYLKVPDYIRVDGATGSMGDAIGQILHMIWQGDVLRFRSATVEYWDGASWVAWPDSSWQNALDGRLDTFFVVPSTQNKLRFTFQLWNFVRIYIVFFYIRQNVSGIARVYTSSDGTTWTLRKEVTYTSGLLHNFIIIRNLPDSGIDSYFRIEFELNTTSDVTFHMLSAIGWQKSKLDTDYPFTSDYNRNALPIGDNAYDLGSSTYRWRNGYFAGTVDAGSLNIGGTVVIDATRVLQNVTASRSIITDFFSSPFWTNIPDKPFDTLGTEFQVVTGELQIASIVRSKISDFFNAPFWANIPDKPFDGLGTEFTTDVNNNLIVNSIDFSKIANRLSSMLTFDSSVTPNADAAYDLGSSTLRWLSAYVANAYIQKSLSDLDPIPTLKAIELKNTSATDSVTPAIVFANSFDPNSQFAVWGFLDSLFFASTTDGWTTQTDILYLYSTDIQSITHKPIADNTYDLGDTAKRWRNLYVVNAYIGDLNFENGWQIVEAEKVGLGEGLILVAPDGKKYRFKLEEVN